MATGEMSLRSAEVLPGNAPDQLLVERCRQGDPTAFARLVALHEGMVFNLAARLIGDAEEAKDVAQDVFLQVYRTLGRFEGRSSLKTWIYRIVVNQCHNRHRWWRRRLEACPQELASGSWLFDRSSRPCSCPRLLDRLAQKRICEARQRTGWGPRLIAGQLDHPHSTVWKVLRRHGSKVLRGHGSKVLAGHGF